MTDKEKLVLRKNYAFLVKKLDAASIRSSLNAEGLLTDYELAEVQAQSVAPAANELILAALKRRAPGFLEKFCRVLEEEPANQHIVDRLREGRHRSYLLIHPTVAFITDQFGIYGTRNPVHLAYPQLASNPGSLFQIIFVLQLWRKIGAARQNPEWRAWVRG